MIRVYIVAASPLARSGLENLVVGRGVSIVGSAPSLNSLSDESLETAPGVVLLDASGGGEGFFEELLASHLASEVSVILLADQTPPSLNTELLRAGVRAILPTHLTREQLFAAMQATVAGLVTLYPAAIATLAPESALSSTRLNELPEALTPREGEVLQMLASGLVNKEIAAKLSISDHTVKFHVASILGKLGASTRTEAVSLGIRRGLVLL